MKHIFQVHVHRWLMCFVLPAFFILFPNFSFSQSYMVHRYSEPDGLPSVNVYGITQDRQGRMWFATRAGIAVYDGVSWEKYTAADGLPTPGYSNITVDRKQRVWALSDSGSGRIFVVYHDIHKGNNENKGPRWITIDGPKPGISNLTHLTSFQLIEQKHKTKPIIAVGTTDRGVFVWNASNQGKWQNLTKENGLLTNTVNGIAVLKGKFYAATDEGLAIINLRNNSNINIDNISNQSLGLPTKKIKGICIEYDNKFPDFPLTHSRIWLSGHQWIGYFDESSLKITLYPVKILFDKEAPKIAMLPDYRGGLYMGTRYNLNYFNYKTHSWESIDMDNGLIGGGANSIFIDYEKTIWIACERGISKIASRRFSAFQRKNGLLEDEVTAVVEYGPGKFVLGHNYGITLYDGNRFIRLPLAKRGETSIPSNRVLDIQVDSKKNIWAAASYAGMAKLNPRLPDEITWYGEENGLLGQVMCIWIDKENNDNMWVGTQMGMFLFEKNQPKGGSTRTGKFKKVIGNSIRKIYGDPGKSLYIGTNQEGVYINTLQNNQWKNARLPGDNRANSVYAIKKDRHGRLLIGTLAGLYILENETLNKFTLNGFQVDRPVYFILEDPKNRLWFGTDNGVIRWNGEKQRKYSNAEGLIGNEANRAAAITDSKGRIWIGTNRSVSIYDEQFDTGESYNPSPRVRLLFIESSDRRISLTANQPVRLGYEQNTVTFHFRGVSFLDEHSIRFKYKLEGFQREWSKETFPYNQMTQYTNLPPGTYRFHLQARNALGVWSDEVVSPEITILNPYYKTWWFFLLIFLLMGSVFYGIFRFLSQKRHAALLEKQVEERTNQLQAVEKRYQDLFTDSKDVVFIITPEGKLIDVNPAGVELFGFSSKKEALQSNSIRSFFNNPEDLNALGEAIERRGYVKDYELIFKRKDGERITTLVTATLVRNPEGKTAAYRGIIRDVTRQKKLEQQLTQAQKMEAIGTLAGGIAHDFNNILGAIMGYAELVLDDAPEGTLMKQNAKHIFSATRRAAELVKQILTFSRRSPRKRKPLILSDIVKEALNLFRSSLPATIEIRQRIQSDPGAVLGDPNQIHQLMLNLCANAAYAMKDTGGILEVALDTIVLDAESLSGKNTLKPGPYLRLTVSDTGHGIPQAVMKRIFEPYFTTKKTGEGVGMGLAVIHGIVKNHGGDISVTSEPGKGSIFDVFFPKIEGNVEPENQLNRKIPCGSERILLVDDEKALAEMGTQMLKRLGYDVVGIANAKKALEIFRQEPDRFHLVISDLTMPHMTGIQLAEEIKNIKPDVPIILCSGFRAALTVEQINVFGISDFITKPINKTELALVVRSVLDSKQ